MVKFLLGKKSFRSVYLSGFSLFLSKNQVILCYFISLLMTYYIVRKIFSPAIFLSGVNPWHMVTAVEGKGVGWKPGSSLQETEIWKWSEHFKKYKTHTHNLCWLDYFGYNSNHLCDVSDLSQILINTRITIFNLFLLLLLNIQHSTIYKLRVKQHTHKIQAN